MISESLVKLGFFLVVGGVLLAIYTGNLFGFSRGIREDLETIKWKKEASKEEKSYFRYYAINEFVRKLWRFLVVIGLLLISLGLLI
ncbi:DUF3899 domain-containing protein [Pseudomonas indica]|uniref:DUF3899 domain-containing protein n=1 Tax=Pseudomonas indica TaxID=137658 RepID=UPI003C6E0248